MILISGDGNGWFQTATGGAAVAWRERILGAGGLFWPTKIGFDAAKHGDFTIPTPLRWKNGGTFGKCNLHFSGVRGEEKHVNYILLGCLNEEG